MTGTASTVATAPAIARVFAEFVWGGKLGWRRSCGRGRDSEQEHTWEQERGLRGTCACGRVCDCDSGCHYGCDCACNRSCVRSTDDPRILLAGSSGTWRSIAVRGLASPGIRSSAGICAWPPPPWVCAGGGAGGGTCSRNGRGSRRGRGGGAVTTCDCGRHCVRGRDCHRDCDCDDDRCCVPLLCPLTDVAGGLPHSAGRNTVQFRT